ncbi:hypothetical protein TWF481_000640 [Arthrobotrys musiformis]|uniref:Uncharacterized protein n=1 Tax=Arthrobotrys musiformis TaxID=47236 RepID=A0AAV9WPA6_9PEZI
MVSSTTKDKHPSQSMLTIPSSKPTPSKNPSKGPYYLRSNPQLPKRRRTANPSFKMSQTHQRTTMTVASIRAYHGLGPKKLGTIHTVAALKRYGTAELQKLRLAFNDEIAKIKATGGALAQEITFSNLDDFAEDAIQGMDNEKQTLTRLRVVLTNYARVIVQIAEDLREEIALVAAIEEEGRRREKEKEEKEAEEEGED